MLTASNIFVKYGDRVLLDNLSVVIGNRDRVGLVGRNGAGKSTLLKIIAKYQSPDEGTISRPSESTMSFLHQELHINLGKTVLDETMTAFEELRKMEERMAAINNEIATRTDYESQAYLDLIQENADLNDRYQLLGGEGAEARAAKVLTGLGFKESDFNRQTSEFSGGWQMRVELAKMLLQMPDYLLLDEPTNHLDIESIIWLEKFLQDYPGAVIVVSHDKEFLDNITNRTVEIELGQLYDYKAPYSKYVQLRAERREKMMAQQQNQAKVIAAKQKTIDRFMAKANKTKMAQSMQKQLDKMERVEVDLEDRAAMKLRFPTAPRSGEVVVELEKINKSYGDLEVLKNIDLKIIRKERVAFVGQNGQGKTTLAKIIVDTLKATSGTVNLGHNVQIGYYAQNQSDALHGDLTLLETMERHSPEEMRTRLRNILGAFMFSGEDADKKVSVLSGGERARLALACLLLRPFNLLVLDEPTNHLDMISKDVLKDALKQYDGTMIVVSHDRDFLRELTDSTLEFRDRQLFHYPGDVEYFLEQRNVENMRAVELHKTAGAETEISSKTAVQVMDFETRKRLLRTISNAEKKIERLEEKKAKMDLQMADEAFYTSPDFSDFMEKYKTLKSEIEAAEKEWEAAQLEWEENGGD